MSDGVVPLLDVDDLARSEDGVDVEAGGGVGGSYAGSYVSMEDELAPGAKARAAGWGAAPCSCGCFGASRRAVLGVSLVASLVLVVVTLTVAVPAAVQKVLDESTLVTTGMFMENPRLDRITLNETSELHDVGPVGATMEACDVEVFYQDELLGAMRLPELDIVGGEVLKFNMQTDLVVLNATAFTKATALILQGHGGRWFIRGSVKVRLPLGLRYTMKLNKLMEIPPTLLEDVTGSDGDVVDGSGTATTLDMVATTSFFSSSVLEMHDLGEFVFDLLVAVDDVTGEVLNKVGDARSRSASSSTSMVKVGEVSTDNFDVRQGLNKLLSRGKVIKTAENEHALKRFMSAYLEGQDQVAYMSGPTTSAALFLDNVVEQAIVFDGATDARPVEVSLIDKETSFQGFVPDLPPSSRGGYNCTVAKQWWEADAKAPTFRGPKIVVHNTLAASILQRNVDSKINLAEPISFNLEHPVLGSHQCHDKKMFARLFTAEGMYKDDPARAPVVTFAPHEKKTVFLPGGPQRGQSTGKACAVLGIPVADGADCCFVAMQVAAACRAEAKGQQFFETELESIFEMGFGDFHVPLDVHQNKIATSFTTEITKGFAADAFLTCKHIKLLS